MDAPLGPSNGFRERRAQKLPWTPQELAWRGRVHVHTIYRHIHEGKLLASRIGDHKYRISDAEARRYLGPLAEEA